jgi:hypothetical protein
MGSSITPENSLSYLFNLTADYADDAKGQRPDWEMAEVVRREIFGRDFHSGDGLVCWSWCQTGEPERRRLWR